MRRGIVIAVLIMFALGALLLWHRHANAPRASATRHAAPIAAAAAPASSEPLDAAHLLASDPQHAAQAWLARADHVVADKQTRLYGADAQAALRLPAAQAWSSLVDLANRGDVGAAAAAMSLASQCRVLTEMPPEGPAASHAIDRAAEKLPAEWRTFVTAVDADTQARMAQRRRDCAGVGGVFDFALMEMDRLMQPDDANVALAVDEDIADDAEAIAALREDAARLGSEEAKRALATRLLRAADADEAREGLAQLTALAATDDSAAATLAMCLRSGCGAFRADPDAAGPWLERAAGNGDQPAAAELINDAMARGDLTSAWAWASYRLDLASAGCFEFTQPTPIWLMQSAQAVFSLQGQLDAHQRAQAQALLESIRQRWQVAARTDLGCT